MSKQETTIKGIQTVAENTKAFWLKKPKGFLFKPGQYFQVYVNDDPHTFSIASAPHEDGLLFATRIRESSAYKQALDKLQEGDSIEIGEVGGQFVLPRDPAEPIIYLVGGIGVTPVRSMLVHDSRKNHDRPITLLFSNQMPETAPFFDELEALKLSRYMFIGTMTRMQDSQVEWSGETGYIDADMLRRYVGDISLPVYYVVGPPRFVSAMMTMLADANISRRNIVMEEFHGY